MTQGLLARNIRAADAIHAPGGAFPVYAPTHKEKNAARNRAKKNKKKSRESY